MKLDNVLIKNFRSIKELTINFDPPFKILIGKNESGKSNIIRALSLLSENNKPTVEDKREFLADEKVEKEFFVRFTFKFDESEINEIIQSLAKETIVKPPIKIISYNKRELTLSEYIHEVAREGLYEVNIAPETRYGISWEISEKYEFLPSIKRHMEYKRKAPTEVLTVSNSLFITPQDLSTIKIKDDAFLAPDISELNEIISIKIRAKVEDKLPNVILWKYDEANLLPNRINITQFSSNPNICIPLKILFNLAGYKDIQSSIAESIVASGNQFDNLLKRVSVKATKHFNEVWKEYPNISFSLAHNGDNIVAAIQEENKYPLIQRSDGFKRFVTFLIIISACTKTKDLENTLLLFDEPDMSLHPSGIRDLRNELIRVSKNNLIVAATHSIFMIDNDCLNRHCIVTKQKEQTTMKTPDADELFEEEILFKAVGYSIYEILKAKNLVFEGWRDKNLFKIALESCPPKYKHLKKDFSKIGFCQSNGVRGMKSLIPIFEAVNRKCLIITDNDEPAEQRKKEYEKIRGFGTWETYKEIDTNCYAITGEDFLKKDYIKGKIKFFKKKHPEINGDPDFSSSNLGILHSIVDWLINGNHKSQEETKILNSEFKSLLFEDLTPKNIDITYYKFLTKVIDKLNSLK